MKDSPTPPDQPAELSPEDMMSALFGNLVMQNSNMALLFLGKMPHPETGKAETDLDAAKLFIDTLEMLELKTKGNLNPQEAAMLKQNLTGLRLAYVDAVAKTPSAPAQPSTPPSAPSDHSRPAAASASDAAAPSAGSTDSADSESRKKFTKKY